MTPTPGSQLLSSVQATPPQPQPKSLVRRIFEEPSDDELIQKLANYGAYHNNIWNKVLHLICVPMVMWSLVIFFRWVGVIIPCKFMESVNLDLTIGTFAIFLYCIWYLSIGRYLVTVSYICALIALTMTANALQKADQKYWPIWVVLGQVVGWAGQLLFGHFLIEHSPAAVLGLSALDSAMMAPIFTWWEIFFALGYDKRFYIKLQAAVQKRIDEVKPDWNQSSAPTPPIDSSNDANTP